MVLRMLFSAAKAAQGMQMSICHWQCSALHCTGKCDEVSLRIIIKLNNTPGYPLNIFIVLSSMIYDLYDRYLIKITFNN